MYHPANAAMIVSFARASVSLTTVGNAMAQTMKTVTMIFAGTATCFVKPP